MKIIQLFNSSVVSGPENLVIRNLQNSGWDWELWNLEETRGDASRRSDLRLLCESLGICYRGFTVRSRHDPRAVQDLRLALESTKPDIVHAHDVKASAYLSWTKFHSIPWVSTHHGVKGRPDLKTKLLERYYRFWILRKFDKVFSVSREDQILLEKTLGKKVSLLRNGVPLPTRLSEEEKKRRKHEVRAEWAKKVGWKLGNDDEFWLGFVGRLSAEKNPLFALETAIVSHQRLIFIGDGALRAEIESRIKAQSLEEQIACLGYESKMLDRYVALDMVLSVSDAEGLPLNLLECGGREVPFLAKAVGGIPEISATSLLEETLLPASSSPQEFSTRILKWKTNPVHTRTLAQALHQKIEADFSDVAWREQMMSVFKDLSSQR